jgi:hypothetical protein
MPLLSVKADKIDVRDCIEPFLPITINLSRANGGLGTPNSRKTMRREGQSTLVAVPDTDGPTE